VGFLSRSWRGLLPKLTTASRCNTNQVDGLGAATRPTSTATGRNERRLVAHRQQADGGGGDSRGGQIRPLEDLFFDPPGSPAAPRNWPCPTRRFHPALTSMNWAVPAWRSGGGRCARTPGKPLAAGPQPAAHRWGLLPSSGCGRAHPPRRMAITWRKPVNGRLTILCAAPDRERADWCQRPTRL